jgi:glycosyltransferase involved in cell wall biosynthesis
VTTTISVALCTFNGERFIGEQVQSILAQTSVPDEIVVSDDASSDNTVTIIEDLVGEFNASNGGQPLALRVLRNDSPLGVTRNFEQAIAATTGELIALCDQDDRWRPDRVEVAVAQFQSRPRLLLLFANARLVDANGDPLGDSLFEALAVTRRERDEVRSGEALAALLGRNLVTGATTVFRRALFDTARPFPDEWVHDEWLAAIAAATGEIDYVDDELVDYRQHGSNEIGAQRPGLLARLAKLREPRESRNRRLVARAAVLERRLVDLGVVAGNLERSRAKTAHEQARLNLPANHLLRLAPVLREAARGGYSRYGRGNQDVLRDLVQPAR